MHRGSTTTTDALTMEDLSLGDTSSEILTATTKSKVDIAGSPPQKRARRQDVNAIELPGLSERIPPHLTATQKDILRQCALAQMFRLPQLEEFSHWPSPTDWVRLIDLENPAGELRISFEKNNIKHAWTLVATSTRTFIAEKLLPYVDIMLRADLKKPEEGKYVMVAFVGLHAILQRISQRISDLFAKQERVPSSKISVPYDPFNVIEEIDIGSYMRGSTRNLSASTCYTPGPSTIPYETSGFRMSTGSNSSFTHTPKSNFERFGQHFRNSDDMDCSPESGPGSRVTKRRRTTPDQDLMEEDGTKIAEQPKEIPVGRPKSNITGCKLQHTRSLVDIDFCEVDSLSEQGFREHLSSFTPQNVSHYFCESIQRHFERFPMIASPVVLFVVNLYETYLHNIGASVVTEWNAEVVQEFKTAFNALNRALFEMELTEEIIAPAIQILCQNRINKHIVEFLTDELETHLENFRPATFGVMGNLLQAVMDQDPEGNTSDSIVVTLLDYAKKEYIKGVVDNFFDLLLQWPKSRRNFLELKQLMDETSQDVIHAVIVSLQRQFHTRLLRPGLNTQDILAVYTAAIRALRIIDPSRVIQDLVCEPVRMYLRSRPDTVRCIMSHITHITPSRDSGSGHRRSSLPALDTMIEEEEAAIALTMLNLKISASDIDMDNWKTWQPDPVYAELLSSTTRTDRQADTIELLMSIYGGQDVFINEYQLILAEKLLGYYPFDPEEESRHLKMMTKRFGESLLQKSEVMSRDASDSQKFHDRILEKLFLDPTLKTINLNIPVKTLVISHNYWPEIRTEKMKVPAALEMAMAKYKIHFEDVSGTRTIDVRPELGHVKFDLTLDDGRTMHVKCNPVYAAIILKFTERLKWAVDELAEAVGISIVLLKRKLLYWLRRNVLEEVEPDVYAVAAEGSFLSEEDLHRMEDEEMDSAVRYVAESNQDDHNMQMQLQMFWKYMTTMLNTVQTITIERLFQMVRMFIIRGQAKREVTIDHLKQFLDAKVRARELVFANNKYSLPKKDAKEVLKEPVQVA